MEMLLTDNDLCGLLHVSRSLLWELRRKSKIPYTTVGKLIRYRPAAIEEWLVSGEGKQFLQPSMEGQQS